MFDFFIREILIALTVGHELVAPEILPFEIGNALSVMVKRSRITPEEALSVFDILQQVPVELRPVEIRKALRLAVEYQIYAYDAYWLECAARLHLPILTLDQEMRMRARDMGIKIIEVKKRKPISAPRQENTWRKC
ncbi:MAG: VapC toxin family PIN domain ribonuclease [Deltaproteobacteria bacterium CG_4_10_14_3_um_filter_60_8]|nr:MAG: hypothetical protein AUK28_05545 [Desulfobacterales bacterium CG2_30_60_27]PIY23905.1 MAG: VapC toxin family PIN domain ribonuclease [Deltaproteobacteria bacterium CG_4_10_14_3_um_filter_60_8]